MNRGSLSLVVAVAALLSACSSNDHAPLGSPEPATGGSSSTGSTGATGSGGPTGASDGGGARTSSTGALKDASPDRVESGLLDAQADASADDGTAGGTGSSSTGGASSTDGSDSSGSGGTADTSGGATTGTSGGPSCVRVGMECVLESGMCCSGSACLTKGDTSYCVPLCTMSSECSGSRPGCCLPIAEGGASVCAPAELCGD